MSAALLQRIRQKYPAYAEVPDDQLTLAIGRKYPVYLEQDPQFKAHFEARQQQVANTADTERATGALGLAKETAKVVAGDAVEASRQLNDTAATLREMPVKAAGRLINWTGQMLAEDIGNVLTATTQLDPVGPVYQGLKESGRVVPQVGAAMALQAAGVPAPLAFGLPAGASTYEATGDVAAAAKSASVGAVIPGAASGARQLTGKALAAGLERGVGPVSSTVQKAVEAVGSQVGVQALMEGMNLPEYIQMSPEQRREAIVRNAFANLAFLPMDVPTVLGKGPSATREAASPRVDLALSLRERVNDPQVIERLVALADEEALLATAPPRTERPIPEPPETLRAQFDATLDPESSKAVTLLVPGTPDLVIPQGLEVVEVPQGFAVFNPKKVAEGTVRQAGAGGQFDGRLLGMSQPTKPTGPVVAVTTKAPDGTPEVVGELVTPKPADIARAAEAQQKAVPGGTTEIRDPQEVLAERVQPAAKWDDIYQAAKTKGVTIELTDSATGETTVETFKGSKASRVVKRQKGIRDGLEALRLCLEGKGPPL